MLKRHQSQSWSRFGRLNLFAKMNEKIWGNIVCKTGTILDVSEQGTFSQSRKDAHQMKRPIWGSWSMWRWLSKEEGHKAMSLLSFCWTVDDSHLAFVGVYDSWCHIITYWHQMVVSPSNSWWSNYIYHNTISSCQIESKLKDLGKLACCSQNILIKRGVSAKCILISNGSSAAVEETQNF